MKTTCQELKMTSLDLTEFGTDGFTPKVLDHYYKLYMDTDGEKLDAIYVTAKQKACLRTPWFQPYNEWRGIPIRLKGPGDEDLRIMS